MVKASVIIPSFGRSESLEKCLAALDKQIFKDFEVIVNGEEGPLAKIRNKAAREARGEILCFIDDDTIQSSVWLDAIITKFSADPDIAGVSGPAFIRPGIRCQRDLFRFRFFKFLYDKFFCEGRERLPGHILRSGAWTTGAAEEDCYYEGEVDFLEACNMAFRADSFWGVGGFDEAYKGVGDWSEPDICFRLKRIGCRLWFTRDARLEHRPSRTGAFKKRKFDSGNRLANYELFAKRWIEPNWKHSLYKQFLRIYYATSSFK